MTILNSKCTTLSTQNVKCILHELNVNYMYHVN